MKFNLTIGSAANATTLRAQDGFKYNVAPRTGQFDATVNGAPQAAWTTEGRGSHYVYFRDGADLYYVKVAGLGETTAARQGLIVTTDAYEEVMKQIEPKPTKAKRVRVAKAKMQG